MLALMVGCVQFFGQSRPAIILVLGSSVPETMQMQAQLSDKLFPHRPVSLLESNDDRINIKYTAGNCFRITFGKWRDAVWRFARSVLVIVVDMRTMTPPVDEELQFICDEGLQFKTVLLKPADMALPIPELASCRVVNSDEQCIEAVLQAFESPATLPSDVSPLHSVGA
jgi:hypothetical protein